MLILALDTALPATQVALFDASANHILASRSLPMATGHAEALLPTVEICLAEARRTYRDLARIAVTTGPGSFTGVRIALSAGRALGLALEIPVIGISTLEIFANPHLGQGLPVLAALDARREEIYAALYDEHGKMLLAPDLTTITALLPRLPVGQLIIAGSAAGLFTAQGDPRLIGKPATVPPLESLVRLAVHADPREHPPKPLYLREADAKPQQNTLARRS